jgi:amidase
MARDSHDDPPNRARRQFLAAGAGSLVAVKAFAHEEITIAEAAARIASGELAAADLLAAYLERIAAIDRAGPRLRAVIELKADARPDGQGGALQGMPILVKDNIATADGMATTAGSLALDGYRAAADAPLVARLREAGAVVFGKTNLSEWANFRSSNSVSGWSSRGGQTRNPYALDRSPSGSSSGSAVAVAANLCAAAIGTETDGSITSPAACNNIVGFKPTLGLVSQAGIVPIAHSQDTAGPMARTVEDCARVMNVINTSPTAIDFTAHLGMAT